MDGNGNTSPSEPRAADGRRPEPLVDDLALLVKTHAVYGGRSQRLQELAERIVEGVRKLAPGPSLTVVRDGLEFRVAGQLVPAASSRRDLVRRLQTLNLRQLTFRTDVTAADLERFVAGLNRKLGQMRRTGHLPTDWTDLPDSIEVDEAFFHARRTEEAADGDAKSRPPTLLLTFRRLKRLVRHLKSLKARLEAGAGSGETESIDVIQTLLDTLKGVETSVPERADALIERTLERFEATVTRLQQEQIPPQVGQLIGNLARRYFARQSGRASAPESEGDNRAKPKPNEATALETSADRVPVEPDDGLAEELDAFLAEDHRCPDIRPPGDRSHVQLLTRFLDEGEEESFLGTVAGHLASVLDRADDRDLEERLRATLLGRLDRLGSRAGVSPLVRRLIGSGDVERLLDGIDLEDAEAVEAFTPVARALWPQFLLPLYERLQAAGRTQTESAVRAVLRAVGREAILGSGRWLRENALDHSDLVRWLRKLKIAEVLPFFEVLFDAPDSRVRQRAFEAVQLFPFRQKAAFWLHAFEDAEDVERDYFHALLAAEWAGTPDRRLFQAALETATRAAFEDEPDRAVRAVRALSLTDTDQAAEALIRVLAERKWGILPGRPLPVRREARRALGAMHCQAAVDWTLNLKR